MSRNMTAQEIADIWGFIPSFLHADDQRSAREQINARYIGGWNHFEGFRLYKRRMALIYSGDPTMYPISMLRFRKERLFIYPHAWVVIMQEDGTWEVARLD